MSADDEAEAQRIIRQLERQLGTKKAAMAYLGLGAHAYRSARNAPLRARRDTIRKVLAAGRGPDPGRQPKRNSARGPAPLPVVPAPGSTLNSALHRVERIASRNGNAALSHRLLRLAEAARLAGDKADLAPLAAALDGIPGSGHVCQDEEWRLQRLTDRSACLLCGQQKALGSGPAVAECLTCGRGLGPDRHIVAETRRRRGLGRTRGR